MTHKRALSLISTAVVGLLAMQSVFAQANNHDGYRLSVVGIAVKDYAKSQDFYANKMGLHEAFKFSSPDGKRTTTYYQLSRDTFLEMQQAAGDAKPGFTHVHLAVDNVNAAIARLKQAGVPGAPRNGNTPGTVTEAGMAKPSNVKNTIIVDPDGLRLELNELLPDSLTKKAAESWSDAYPSYRLYVIGVGYKDFAVSDEFYEKKMGLRVAFLINSPTHPYLQLSRDTFIDFLPARDAAPSFNHVHLVVDDLTATIARLKQKGIETTAPQFSPPSQLYSANITDPDGLRLEVNQWVDSLPKKAAEAWK